MANKIKFETVAQYLDSLTDADKQTLLLVRTALLEAAPDAVELIHYQIPALTFKGKVFVYFAVFKNHIHITIPHPRSVFEAFASAFADLDISKSTIRLPKNAPIPLDLLKKAIKCRVDELYNKKTTRILF